jgi:hypothetical protein
VHIFVLQSLLGHSTPKSTQIYIHPSMKKARQALENLPGVVILNQLVQSDALKCRFQSKYKSGFEFADIN